MKKKLLSIAASLVVATALLLCLTLPASATTYTGTISYEQYKNNQGGALWPGYYYSIDVLTAGPGYIRVAGWMFKDDYTQIKLIFSSSDGDKTVNLGYRSDVRDAYSLPSSLNTGFDVYLPFTAGSYSGDSIVIHSLIGSTPYRILKISATVTKPTATFDIQGGSGGTASIQVDFNKTNPTITPPTRAGYDFQGYYSKENGEGTKYWNSDGTSANVWKETGGRTVYAYWTLHDYTVTLNNGGEQIKTSGTASVSATYTKAMPTITVPERHGYNFKGYFTQTSGGTKYYNADGTSAQNWDITQDTTLYAQWETIEYSITYKDNNETITGSTAAKINDVGYTTKFTAEDAVTLPVDVTKENAIFVAWYETIGLSGNPIFQWATHSRTANQELFAKWISISGTRADSEKQGFDASLFDAEAPTYSTAQVTVNLDGAPADVNLVQLKKGDTTLTMGGSNGVYSYTTSEDVTGSWDIWVNGTDSGKNVEFGTPAVVDMVTASVTIMSDDAAASNKNVVLKTTGGNLTLSESGTAGVYTLQTFAANASYDVYVDDVKTGKTLSIANATDSKISLDYYTASITVKKDGTKFHMGAVDLKHGATVLSVTGSEGTYTINKLKDTATEYSVFVDGKDTDHKVKFTADNKSATVNYYTITVQTKRNNTAAQIADVTLRDSSNAIVHTMNSTETGVYTFVSQEDTTVYKVFVGSDDTSKTAKFTAEDKNPAAIDYYTAQVTTKLDGIKKNMGTVELKPESGNTLTLISAGTGLYELAQLKDSTTVYDVYIGGELVGKQVKFDSDNRVCEVLYTTLTLTTNLDGTPQNVGTAVLKGTGLSDITMNYDATAKAYKAVTCFAGDRDIYVNSENTGASLMSGAVSNTVNYYTLRYVLDGGQGAVPSDTVYLEGTTVDLPQEIPTKADHQFVGWQDNASPAKVYTQNKEGSFGSIAVNGNTNTLTAQWRANASYEARYALIGSSNWEYATAQFALEYAASHSDSTYAVEICLDATVTDGTEIPSNVYLKVPTGSMLTGDITNKGIIDLGDKLDGTVTNYNTIGGNGTVNVDDTLSATATITNLVNTADGTVCNSNILALTSNAGTLKDCQITAGKNVGGKVEGTIYAMAGVTFAGTLITQDAIGAKAVISVAGSGTIASAADINGMLAFAGLMHENDGHYASTAIIHPRSKLTVTNNQIYADFFDFAAPENLVYDGTAKTPTFTSDRTPGVGTITAIAYRKSTGATTWSDWTSTAPITVGTYQVKITVADGDYYYGKADVADSIWNFTITAKPVSVTWTAPTNLVYNKQAKEPSASVSDYLVGNDECTVNITLNTGDNVNVTDAGFTYKATGLTNENYTITNGAVSDTYYVTKKVATLKWTAPSDLVYSRTAKTPGVEVTNLESGDSCSVTAALTDGKDNVNVGSFTFTASALGNANYKLPEEVVSDEYTITKKELSVTGSTAANKTYDGDTVADITTGSLVGVELGDTVSIATTTGAFDTKEVGTAKKVTVSYTLTGSSVANYSVKNSETTANITRMVITVTPDADQSKVYDTSDPVFTYTASDTVTGETAKFEGKLSRVPGEDVVKDGYAITIGDLALVDNGSFLASNYELKLNETAVVFTIFNSNELTVNATSYEGTYDGQTHGDAAVTSIKTGVKVTYSTDGGVNWSEKVPTITNVGELTVKVKAEKANYDTDTCEYTLKVNKRAVTLTSANDSKVYDNTALTNQTVTVTGDGFVEGEGATYDVTGTQTNAGENDNAFTYTLNEGTKAGNYEISMTYGKLTVTKLDPNAFTQLSIENWEYGQQANAPEAAIAFGEINYLYKSMSAGDDAYTSVVPTEAGRYVLKAYVVGNDNYADSEQTIEFAITQKDATKDCTVDDLSDMDYTGAALEPQVIAKDGAKDLVEGTDFIVTYSDNKNAGTAGVQIDFIGNYKGTVNKEFTINKLKTSIETASGSKTYDGMPLTKNTAGDVVITGFVGDEGVEIVFTGTQTNVGESENTFTYTAKKGTILDNYEIDVTLGKLTVSKQMVNKFTYLNIESWKYGQQANSPKAEIAFGKVKYLYKLTNENDDAYTSIPPTEAGNYILKAYVEETENYVGAEKIAVFSIIAPAEEKAFSLWDIIPYIIGGCLIAAAVWGFFGFRKRRAE